MLLAEAFSFKPVVGSQIKLKELQTNPYWMALKKKLQEQITTMEMYRLSWWQHWARLAEYFLPRRYHWLIIANKMDRGSPINGNIVDATGTIAARTLAAGLMSGLTSPTRPWFRVEVGNDKLMEDMSVKRWCDAVQRVLLTIMSESNFYDSIAQLYFDLVVFGTGVMIIYEDHDTAIRCYNPCAGEYYLAVDGALRVRTLGRKFTLTVNQIVDMFGDNTPQEIKDSQKMAGGSGQREYVVAHVIEPNKPVSVDYMEGEKYPVPKKFSFRETYWVFGDKEQSPLAINGFNEQIFIAPRWDVTSNDPYGRSACMDALPDQMQLQFETKRKGEAIEKQVRPPLMADVSLKNEPTSSVAGGITYVTNLANNPGMKPVYQVQPDLRGMMEDIKEVQARIKTILFNDLFLMISQLDTVRTATEIDARREEKLIQLGPVIERLTGNEGLDTALDRIFAIAARKGLIPPAPPAIRGMAMKFKYISMLAEAQRAIGTASIERVFQFAGNLAGAKPDIMDKLDAEEGIDKYADMLHVPASIVRDKRAVDNIRRQRDQKQQQADLLQQTLAGAKGAKDLSETNVGGGKNVLEMMMGNQ